jgi:glycine cleavage system H protein
VSGTVMAANDALATAPEQVNKDAHAAWLIKIKVKDPSEMNALLSAADYDKFVSEEAGH